MDKKIQKQMAHARQHLEQDETPVAIVFGMYTAQVLGYDSFRNGIFIATERRLIFFSKRMFGFDLESFTYSKISSIELNKDFTGHTISFFASGNKIKMECINRGDIQKFVEYVCSSIGKKESSALGPSLAIDPIEQIKKLAELKDAGLLTDEEFTSKKQDLLARM